jgi:hypothetical protein
MTYEISLATVPGTGGSLPHSGLVQRSDYSDLALESRTEVLAVLGFQGSAHEGANHGPETYAIETTIVGPGQM